jgi:hypothetical protein
MGELHDPVILAEIDWLKWLGEEPASLDLGRTMRPFLTDKEPWF